MSLQPHIIVEPPFQVAGYRPYGSSCPPSLVFARVVHVSPAVYKKIICQTCQEKKCLENVLEKMFRKKSSCCLIPIGFNQPPQPPPYSGTKRAKTKLCYVNTLAKLTVLLQTVSQKKLSNYSSNYNNYGIENQFSIPTLFSWTTKAIIWIAAL